MKKTGSILFFLLLSVISYATHNRAGEITYQHLGGLKYRVTIYTYTDVGPGVVADRPELEIFWGDGDTSTLPRSNGPLGNGELIGNETKKNIYTGEHTYPGPGNYKVYMQDANRNEGVVNVPGSVNLQFYIESFISISPFGTANYNSSPVLLNPPVDYNACVSQVFIHNPGAYDPDGDSLSYQLVNCRGEDGYEIAGYSIPSTVTLNSTTGDLIWSTPSFIGEFNYAILIEEWRKSGNNYIRIGYVLRDLQVKVSNCLNNTVPEITAIDDTCVVANSYLNFLVSAHDPNGNLTVLTGVGGPFQLAVSPATFQSASNYGDVSSTFKWQTKCSHVRLQPYSVLFKAVDNGSPNLTGYKTVNIKVIGPAVLNPLAAPQGNSVVLTWDKNVCNEVTSYQIYKKNNYYGFVPGYCETGVPAYTGYSLIGTVNGLNNSYFTDDNNGIGLVPGVEYCYMIVSVFPDGSESIASVETCTKLKNDVPVITNVSIDETDISTGKVYVAWSRPTELDTIQNVGPFRYLVYHAEGTSGIPVLIDSSSASLNDTIYSHINIDTKNTSHNYRIDLYNTATGNRYKIGSSYLAPSIYLNITPVNTGTALKLEWNNNTPWHNDRFVVYKQNSLSSLFDSIAVTDQTSFIDDSLINGNSYCYKIKSVGMYSVPGFINPIVNFSQENCGIPEDKTPPCSPLLAIIPDCPNHSSALTWTNPNNTCTEKDAVKYNVYYKPFANGIFSKILEVNNITDTTWIYQNATSIAGCYYISALDKYNNESPLVDSVCIDNCPIYTLPNVFTPDGDGINDLFKPLIPYQYVESVNTQIFNRWGRLVFESNNININWNGVDMNSNKICSDGVYFYVCKVNQIRLTGIETILLQGYVELFRNSETVPVVPGTN